jgi:urease accessory protein UreE
MMNRKHSIRELGWELGNRIRSFPEAENETAVSRPRLLKAVIESSGMTQAELAKVLDIDQAIV